jgi:hypothetical protein
MVADLFGQDLQPDRSAVGQPGDAGVVGEHHRRLLAV